MSRVFTLREMVDSVRWVSISEVESKDIRRRGLVLCPFPFDLKNTRHETAQEMNATVPFGPFSFLGPETTVGLPVSLVVLFTIAVTVAVLVFPRASGSSYGAEITDRLRRRLTRRARDVRGRSETRRDLEEEQVSESLV